MTDNEYKHELLKKLGNIASELKAIRIVLTRSTDKDQEIIKEYKDAESFYKQRKFKCYNCGWETYTDKYRHAFDPVTKREVAYLFCEVCAMPIKEPTEPSEGGL